MTTPMLRHISCLRPGALRDPPSLWTTTSNLELYLPGFSDDGPPLIMLRKSSASCTVVATLLPDVGTSRRLLVPHVTEHAGLLSRIVPAHPPRNALLSLRVPFLVHQAAEHACRRLKRGWNDQRLPLRTTRTSGPTHTTTCSGGGGIGAGGLRANVGLAAWGCHC